MTNIHKKSNKQVNILTNVLINKNKTFKKCEKAVPKAFF